MADKYNLDTLNLHAGHIPDPVHGSRAVPIHQTTSYVFQSSQHAASLFNMEQGGHLYSRISNPTVAVLEQRVAALTPALPVLPRAVVWLRFILPCLRWSMRVTTLFTRASYMAPRST